MNRKPDIHGCGCIAIASVVGGGLMWFASWWFFGLPGVVALGVLVVTVASALWALSVLSEEE